MSLAQWWMGTADGLARYRTPDAPCPPASQVHRLWRCSGTTCASEFNQRVDPTGVTIHSMHPLLITVDFPATRVMGPIPAGTLPNPLGAGSIVTSVVISE